jgi:hypothetical protein
MEIDRSLKQQIRRKMITKIVDSKKKYNKKDKKWKRLILE